MLRHVSLATFAILGLFAAPLRADVIVVDPHGGPGAALLQSALDAAQPGDIVVVEPGDYASPAPLTLPPNKGVALIADAPGIVLPGFLAEKLGAGQLVLLRGFEVRGAATSGLTCSVQGSGALWVEDCTVIGRDGWWDDVAMLHVPTPAMSVSMNGPVVVSRSRFEGGRGPDATLLPGGGVGLAGAGETGLIISTAHLSLCETAVLGGRGGDGTPGSDAAHGGVGLLVAGPQNSFVMGGSMTGGDEGFDNPASTQSGPGISFLFTHLKLRGTTVLSGKVNGVGIVPPPIAGLPSGVSELPAPPRFVALDSPAREFGHVGVHVSAQPGDLAWLFVSTAPGAVWLPPKQGACMVDPTLPVLPVLLGPVDATGALTFDAQLPALPPGMDSAVFFAQLAVADAQGQALLGSASSLVWISASF